MQKYYSEKTIRRISEIESNINYHHKNILRLKKFSKGRLIIEGKKYLPTKETDACLHWSIKNLNAQIKLLQLELNVLLEYGA